MENKAEGQCESTGCSRNASVEVFWPGNEPIKMCATCAIKAQGVGKAMGVHIPIRRLENVPKSK